MSDDDFQLPSDEQRLRDRQLIEAVEAHVSVGEQYARSGEVLPVAERAPMVRPDPTTSVVPDPTPVQLAVLPDRRAGRRFGRRVVQIVAVIAALGCASLAFSFWQVWSVGRSDQARAVDAIVVLGAAQYDGRPSPQLEARLDHAVDLWTDGFAPRVVVTGGNQPGDRFTEADASAAFLVERGVPSAAIVLEGDGSSTWESLSNVEVLVEDSIDSILIVTDPYHAQRSRLIAQSVGFRAFVSPTPTSVVSGTRELRRELGEAAGVAVGRLVGFERLSALTD